MNGEAAFRTVEPLAQHDPEREVTKVNTIVPEVIARKDVELGPRDADFDRPGFRGIAFTIYDISYAEQPKLLGEHVALSSGVTVLTGQPGPEPPRTNIRRPEVQTYGDIVGER